MFGHTFSLLERYTQVVPQNSRSLEGQITQNWEEILVDRILRKKVRKQEWVKSCFIFRWDFVCFVCLKKEPMSELLRKKYTSGHLDIVINKPSLMNHSTHQLSLGFLRRPGEGSYPVVSADTSLGSSFPSEPSVMLDAQDMDLQWQPGGTRISKAKTLKSTVLKEAKGTLFKLRKPL